MTKFSVIIPIYNVEKYLRQCIDSVLNQTYSDFEMILVDDGSPDNCPAICDDYAKNDSRVKVIHKTNGGLVSARKAGANASKGDYIVCIDGDDWVDNTYLENFDSVIKECSPDIITCQFVYAYDDESLNRGSNSRYRTGYYSKEDIKNEIYPSLIHDDSVKYFPPSIWAKAYRSDLYKKYQSLVNEKIKIGEDSACTIPFLFHADSLYITEKRTCFYRQNVASMTKERKAFDWESPELVHSQIKIYTDLATADFEEQLYRKTVHELFTAVLSQFNRDESYFSIVNDIKIHLKSEIYSECIKKAKFRSWNGRLMTVSLKYRLFSLIKLFHALKSVKQKRNMG